MEGMKNLFHVKECVWSKFRKENTLIFPLGREINLCGKTGPPNVKNCVAVLKQMKRGRYNTQFIYLMPYFP